MIRATALAVFLAFAPLTVFPALAEDAPDTVIGAAHIANGLSIASSMKMRVMEFYMDRGEFPDSNEDLGLPDPSSLGSGSLRSLEIDGDGEIVLTYGPETGIDGGEVRLVPEEGPMRVSWTCTTRDYARLPRYAPQCVHEGSPASAR
ncbi:MAG: pilin [Myxococcota bacterium]|nr:pilin [Myxococcota bacterium]